MGIVVDAGDARADPRTGRRRPDPAEPALVVDLLRQRADRRSSPSCSAWRMLPQTGLRRGRARSTCSGWRCSSTASPRSSTASARSARTGSLTAPIVVWPIVDRRSCCSGVFGWHALRVERPLLDVRLYANRVFAAASLTTFGLGAALFGAMILVPLYYQQVRDESVIVTGPAGRSAGPRDAARDAAHRPPDRSASAAGASRSSACSLLCAQLDPARLHRREHLDRLHLRGAAAARRRHRPLASCPR